MKLADIIVIAVIVLIIGAALVYIIKAKKSGADCGGGRTQPSFERQEMHRLSLR